MRRSEKGRSMVEMLGVLAIIGVLSVGGIYGYTVAMNKYKANEIVQTASMLKIMAESKNAGEGECLTLADSDLAVPAGITKNDMKADKDGKVYIKIDTTAGVGAAVDQIVTGNENFEVSATANVSCT
jgi:Tfp pilus assembly protein PilE